MKYYLILFLFFTSHALALDAEVAAVKIAIATQNPSAIQQSLVALQLAVNDHELNDGSLYSNPSPARQQTRNEIKQALSPIKEDLVALATSDSLATGNAITLLGFSDGGTEVYQALSKNVATTERVDIASTSLFSLNKLGLADEEVRTEAVKRLAAFDPNDHSGGGVPGAIFRVALDYPLPEGLDTFMKFINPSYDIGMRVGAAKAIMAIGPSASKALPELEKLLAFLKANNGDFRDINTVERAIQVVSGSPVNLAPATQSSFSDTSTPTTQSSSGFPTSTPIPSVAPQSHTSPASSIAAESPFPRWLVGVIVLSLGLIGILWYRSRPKQ